MLIFFEQFFSKTKLLWKKLNNLLKYFKIWQMFWICMQWNIQITYKSSLFILIHCTIQKRTSIIKNLKLVQIKVMLLINGKILFSIMHNSQNQHHLPKHFCIINDEWNYELQTQPWPNVWKIYMIWKVYCFELL
jgi:hypothetical protein